MFDARYRLKLDLQRRSGLYRNPLPIDRRDGKYIYSQGTRLINMASNDYLGLGTSPSLRRKVADNFKRYGSSSSSSRLVAGNFRLLNEAEKAYADYFGYEEALFFPSGYQANMGVLATLFEAGDRVLFDKHIHVSSVKGLKLAGATLYGYNHNCFSHLEKRLPGGPKQAAVVTESLFSMDGDALDVQALWALKQRYGFMCVVDEAHAFGALGPGGRGLARDVADVAVGTFGKALGLFGALVLLSAELKDFLVNFSSPLIYTTALPEAHAASAFDVLEQMAQCRAERRSLSELSRWLRGQLRDAGFSVSGDAHIVALEIGDEAAAVQTAQRLFDSGFFVLPARYPTVPLQRAILRVSLTCLHTQADAAQFMDALKEAYAPHA